MIVCSAGNQKRQKDTLLKLCSEKKGNALKSSLNRFTQQLSVVRAVHDKDARDRHETEDTEVVDEIAEKQDRAKTEQLSGVKLAIRKNYKSVMQKMMFSKCSSLAHQSEG